MYIYSWASTTIMAGEEGSLNNFTKLSTWHTAPTFMAICCGTANTPPGASERENQGNG